jgi:hypothetical protein
MQEIALPTILGTFFSDILHFSRFSQILGNFGDFVYFIRLNDKRLGGSLIFGQKGVPFIEKRNI